MDGARITKKIGSQHDDADLSALMDYIEELENVLAKKDTVLAAKDQCIDVLEAHVTTRATTSSISAFRARPKAELVTPRVFPHGMAPSPNQVSDGSDEMELESQAILNHSLVHIISRARSDEDPTIEHATSDGRWNIPFDGSFEDLMAKSPPGQRTGNENVSNAIGFVPIGEKVRGCSGRLGVTPVKPVARSWAASSFAEQHIGPLKNAAQEKENIVRMRMLCPEISTCQDIR